MTEATPLASEQITQEDREAAANCALASEPSDRAFPYDIRRGYLDNAPIVQAFARHRIAALSASPAPSGQGVSGEVERLRDHVSLLQAKLMGEMERSAALLAALDEIRTMKNSVPPHLRGQMVRNIAARAIKEY